VTSFFGIKDAVFFFFENDKTDLHQIFFQKLGENTSLQSALKALHPAFKDCTVYKW